MKGGAEVVGLDTLQVVGSRVADRSAQDSPVPVDIIQGEDLQTYGIRDMDWSAVRHRAVL